MVWLWVLLACSGDGSDDTNPSVPVDTDTDTDADTDTDTDTDTDSDTDSDTDTDTDTDSDTDTGSTGSTGLTGDTATPSGAAVTCTLTSNVLRAWCDITLDTPDAVQLRFAKAGGGTERVHTSQDVDAVHQIPMYLMAESTTYQWTLEPLGGGPALAAGQLTTGALPPGMAADYNVTGSGSASYILHTHPCISAGAILVSDSDGELLWYQETGELFFAEGTSYTEDETFLVLYRTSIYEFDWMGNKVLQLDHPIDYSQTVHHDVMKANGYVYALYTDPVVHNLNPYTLDGVYVFDGSGAVVGTWRLYDHFQPPEPDPRVGPDYSHANAVWVADDGTMLLSFRHMSTVAAVDGDPTSPTFGDVLWVLEGDQADAAWRSDFTVTGPLGVTPNFEKQHNPHFLPDGRLTLFDNRRSIIEPSRVLAMELDLVAGTAHIDEEYELPMHCDFQGGAWRTASGNPIGTCAQARTGHEFDVASGLVTWTMQASCPAGVSTYVPRLVPIEH